jgi:hypothetical protein
MSQASNLGPPNALTYEKLLFPIPPDLLINLNIFRIINECQWGALEDWFSSDWLIFFWLFSCHKIFHVHSTTHFFKSVIENEEKNVVMLNCW